ncbi:alpha-ketoglutarate decarboxylase [Hwangdonia lutea]|uniref:Alpha-ketoglutarate decarboxylase n=1 Tax=Hwangdonia lutea TaxID=3075823 RepID=A0AA97EJZ6_9FLAO|nr:alpha-ketoglutarate decarboxylase [Hwangdonia sp. SCSIO 19198]WOD42035.1 alpha-ketoglutarate decarboxylase [Hwangdonia sp. SCSIO 19198]
MMHTFKKTKSTLLFIYLFVATNIIIAQQQKHDFWNQVRFGGGVGLSFGDGYFSGTLAPSAVYEFDRNFAFGLGLNATFNNQKNVYKSTILGGSLIGLFNVVNEFQLSTEFEQLNVNRTYNVNLNLDKDNYWVPALFIGAGYRNGQVTFGVRYDVLYDADKSIYANAWAPFVRFYF